MANEWLKCPKCGSEEISSGSMDKDFNIAWCNTQCEQCGFEWIETYSFCSNEDAETTVELDDNGNPITGKK
jgi:transcription elongation factor Elf1